MAKRTDSPTSFTEFAPLSPEQDTKSFSFWNFFRKQHTTAEKADSNVESPQFIDNEADAMQECESHSTSFSSDVDIENFMKPFCPSEINSENLSNLQNRNMNSILQIVRNMIGGRTAQSYKDSDFKQYWMPDSNCKECYECGDKFTTFRRRHHCRVCGQIFCKRCCNQGIPGKIIGYSGDLRVCTYCYKMVSSCMQSFDSDSELPKDLQSFHDDIKQNLSQEADRTSISNSSLASRRKSSVVGFREEDIAQAKSDTEYGRNLVLDSGSPLLDPKTLEDLYKQLIRPRYDALLRKKERNPHVILDTYIRGYDVVEWLVTHNAVTSRSQAVTIGQSFLDADFLECEIANENKFVDGSTLYQLKRVDKTYSDSAAENQESMEPLWVKEIQNASSDTRSGLEESEEFCIPTSKDTKIEGRSRIPSSSSSFYLDLDLKESIVKVSRPIHQEQHQHVDASNLYSSAENEICQDRTVNLDITYLNEGMHNVFSENVLKVFNANVSKNSQDCQNMQQLKDEHDSKTAFDELNLSFKNLINNLLRQLLESDGLSSSWCEVILPIVHRVIDMVHPDVKNDADSMDIRQYVQFKKIPGGSKSECAIVSGVVFSKTVAHRKMNQIVHQPTLLLLSSPISYQRTENKLTSLDPVLMQEFEYLKNTICKLTVCKPDVLLVEKSVSRFAQEMLLLFGITVALNVKPTVMERVARCTQAAVVSTVDAHLSKPQLGTCKEFKVKTYIIPGGKTKTLMFLDGCPANLGCTILLRGGSSNELKKVKQKVQFMLYVVYNWKLERSFLMDEFALPPQTSSDELLDSFDNTTKMDCSLVSENLECKTTDLSSDDMSKLRSAEFHSSSLSSYNTMEVGEINKMKLKADDTNRKLETKCVDDFSDPLHSYLRSENDVVFVDVNDLQVSTLPVQNTFRKLLDDIILCCSLNIKVSLPYLETEAGKKNPLRKYFPPEIYWSSHFTKENESKLLNTAQVNFDEENELVETQINNGSVEIIAGHDFTAYKITDVSSKALDLHMLLADFRARGCTIKYLCPHQCSLKGKEKKTTSSLPSNTKEAPKLVETTNAGLCWERKVDALDPTNHQKLAVLFCSYSCTSNNAPNYCVNPWVVKMDFYGCNDIPFGGFLERYCFRPSYVCPSVTCDTPMTEHVRKFVHESGCVHILLQELSSGVIRIQQSAENSILMWSWCYKCKQASPVTPMSQDTWSFSFAKYLELRFYADSYTRQRTQGLCCHSLHHDHYQYFAYRQVIAIFQYSPIVVWEIALPSLTIPVKDEAIPLSSVVEEIKNLAVKGCEIYNTVVEKLSAFKHQYLGTSSENTINNLLATQKAEHAAFRAKIEQIQLRVTSPTLESMQLDTLLVPDKNLKKSVCNFMWKVEDQVTSVKHYIEESVHLWNCRIQDFISSRRKEEKLPFKPPLSNKVSETEDTAPNAKVENLCGEGDYENAVKNDVKNKFLDSAVNSDNSSTKLSHKNELIYLDAVKNIQRENSRATYETNFIKKRSRSWERFPYGIKKSHSTPGFMKIYSAPNLGFCDQNLDYKHEAYEGTDNQSISSSGSSYTYGVTPGIYAGLMVPEPEDDESYVVCHKEQCHGQSNESALKGHERSASEGHQCLSDSPLKVSHDRVEEGAKQDKKERTVRTLISQFLSNSEVSSLQSPFPPTQHIIMEGEEDRIPIIVYDEEPSSIIAYTLASADYEQQLQELRMNLTSTLGATQRDSQSPSPLLKKRQNSKMQTEIPTDSDSLQLPCDEVSDITLCSSQETDKGNKSANRMTNLEIQFSDNNAKFYCRVYYAEQFRKLRCLVFNEGEERFIRSLSHCIPWEARGGKSGSTFCKTRDDRFILKQMQRLELQSFLNFAPSYFYYLNKACMEQKPTLLAKIVGVYRIGFKNNATNTASKMDLLVMENLFYDRNIVRKYDLKGSIRNRLVNTSGLQEDDIVLLDENLLKITCDNPLYIRPHSKTVLSLAIDNDTQFLSEQEVMDYSLLVGLDEEKMELVVGIIDYIRTFTWGKKVEMLVKSSGILGGHGKMPTVVSPELYRMRFREAMDGYFLWVPDRWTGKDNNCGLFK